MRVREAEGCMATFESGPPAVIIERHSPMAELFVRFPETEGMERDMFERVLGAKVRRTPKTTGGLYECTFEILKS
jgi:predicted ArsR family transcriptional regulator